MEKKYLKEIEAIAKKYDYWDESKSPYAFLVSYENDTNPGVAHKFITKRMKGGSTFRECVNKMITNFSPDVIVIDEYTGIKGNPLSQYPQRIRLSEESNQVPVPTPYQDNRPMAPTGLIDNVFDGLSGIEGFEGVKNGLGALLAFERERHTKDMMIDRLNYDRKFHEMEMKTQLSNVEERLERLVAENKQLNDELQQTRKTLESLEDANDELMLENEQYKPNKLIKEVGISTLTNVAMQLATKSPMLKGLLGIEDEPVAQPKSAQNQTIDFVKADESQLNEQQRQTLKIVNEVANSLVTWPAEHINRFINIMAFIEDNEERQVELIQFINEQLQGE
jgi:hypothetical protein